MFWNYFSGTHWAGHFLFFVFAFLFLEFLFLNSLSGTPWAGQFCFFYFLKLLFLFYGIPSLGPSGLVNCVYFVFLGILKFCLDFPFWDPLGPADYVLFGILEVCFGIPFLGPLGLAIFFLFWNS